MDKNVKKEYVAPVIVVKSVEVESPICSGSMADKVQADSPATISTGAQEVNSSFETPNTFTSTDDWD